MPEELALAPAPGLAALGTQHTQGPTGTDTNGSSCQGQHTGRSSQGPTAAQGSSTYLFDLGPVIVQGQPVGGPCDSQEAAQEARSESPL